MTAAGESGTGGRRQTSGGKISRYADAVVFDLDDGKEHGPGIITGVIPTEHEAAARLDALAPARRMSIAEIGTDTGWTAALLDHLLQGGHIVTAADTERLADVARQSLAHYPRVRVVCGPSADALGPPGSFDGLISHRAVARVPWEWVNRVRPGGRLCLPVLTGLGDASTLLALEVAQDGCSASGRFMPGPDQQTLWLREQRPGKRNRIDPQQNPRVSQAPSTTPLRLQPGMRVFAGLLQPGLHMELVRGTATLEGKAADRIRLHDHRASRALLFLNGDRAVNEWGPRDLGTDLLDAIAQWHAAGEPELQQLGLTITESEHTLWLGAPDGPSWPLPGLNTPTSRTTHHAT